MKRKALFVLSLILLASLAIGQTTSLNITYTWSAPTTGSAVHHYVVQTSTNGGTAWTTVTAQPTAPSVTVAAPAGSTFTIRVAGVDASGRQGVWSDPSDPFFVDPGQPGAPGKPVKS